MGRKLVPRPPPSGTAADDRGLRDGTGLWRLGSLWSERAAVKADEAIRAACDLSAGMTRPVFRGQANAKWALHSGAVRRVVGAHSEQLLSLVTLLQDLVREYHRDELLLPMETIEGKGPTDLQKLTMLQHLGAGTGLLDFTESPLIALWFACEADPDDAKADGAVFAVDIGNHSVATNGRRLDDPLDLTALPRELVCYYEPDRSLGARVVAQQSVFLIGNPLIPEQHTTKCVIPAKTKRNVVQSLLEMGLSGRALFRDVQGLAAMNGPKVPLARRLSTSQRYQKEAGDLAYQERRFDDALLAYQAFAASHPRVAEPHCLLGDTFAALRHHEEAVAAYTDALTYIETPIVVRRGVRVDGNQVGRPMLRSIYFNRGNAHAALGNHTAAVADFGEALRLDDSLGLRSGDAQYNRANSRFELGEHADAFEDFQAVEGRVHASDARLGMGNCRIMLGDFDLALECFEQGAREGGATSEDCQRNATHTHEVLAVVDGREFEVVRHGLNLDVKLSGLSMGTSGLLFAGCRGNVGNSPSTIRTAPGGRGYGARPFVVQFVENGRARSVG